MVIVVGERAHQQESVKSDSFSRSHCRIPEVQFRKRRNSMGRKPTKRKAMSSWERCWRSCLRKKIKGDAKESVSPAERSSQNWVPLTAEEEARPIHAQDSTVGSRSLFRDLLFSRDQDANRGSNGYARKPASSTERNRRFRERKKLRLALQDSLGGPNRQSDRRH